MGNQEEFDDREGHDDPGTRPDYGDGYFTDGMGSSLQRHKDRRPVVPLGEQEPHQLSRTPGSYICSEVVCQEQEGQPHSSQNGRMYQCCICSSYSYNYDLSHLTSGPCQIINCHTSVVGKSVQETHFF